jgi:hypothetical protein
MGRVIYGSTITAFFEEKKANLASRTGRRITSMLAQIGLKEKWTKPLRGRPEGRRPCPDVLGALVLQLSFL